MAEIFHTLWHVLLHALLDTLMVLPFLFLTYLLMEFLEHRAGERAMLAIKRAGKAGPAIGAALGLLPQCGFSAAAAGLFAGRVVTFGTLLAVFLSTSDEMIAVFLGAGLPLRVILVTLAVKFVVAALLGFLADILLRKRQAAMQVEELCEAEGCHCEEGGVLRSALHHTLHIAAFVFAVNLLLGSALEFVGAEKIASLLGGVPVLSQAVAALVGLIPNCAASVAVATLYAKGVLSAGAMMAGLLTGAGAGLLVLFRTNRRLKENLIFVCVLFLVSVLFGCLFDYAGLAVLLGLGVLK